MKLPPFRENAAPSTSAAGGVARSWMAGIAAAVIVATLVGVLLASRMIRTPTDSQHAASPNAGATPVASDVMSTAPFNCLGGEGLGAGPSYSIAEVTRVAPTTARGYDRLTIEFSVAVPSQASLSSTTGTTFADQLGGRTVKLAGTSGALLTLRPADGHTRYHGPTDLEPNFPVVREMRQVQDSGGVVQWAIGLTRAPCYRMTYLADPLAVVIDFQGG
jgi:hypothetical protein